jgi:protein-L-isoaspartate(D-aspartate) O-methyltransferase
MRRTPSAGAFAAQRADMVEWQLRRRGIHDQRVLDAMAAVPRELFVPERYRRRAYADSALPIGHGQTISQPWIVAAICQALALEGSEPVLEVGTGSGYSTAVLAILAAGVITIERVEELAVAARQLLAELGVRNVEVVVADGSAGLPDHAPYQAIAVHATAPSPPPTLIEQLAPGGRLVIPIATDAADMLTVFRRLDGHVDPESADGLERTVIGPCRFVPLIGSEGYPE